MQDGEGVRQCFYLLPGGLLFNEYRGLNSDKEFQPQVTSLGFS